MINITIEAEEKYINELSLFPTELNGIYKKREGYNEIDVKPWTSTEIKYLLGSHKVSIFLSRIRNKFKKFF